MENDWEEIDLGNCGVDGMKKESFVSELKYGNYLLGRGECGKVVRSIVLNFVLGREQGVDFGALKQNVRYDLMSRSRGIVRSLMASDVVVGKSGGNVVLRKGEEEFILGSI